MFEVSRAGGRERAMRSVLLGRFVYAAQPPLQQQRPERDRAGKDEQSKTPRAARGMRVNLLNTGEDEWDCKRKAASEIEANRD